MIVKITILLVVVSVIYNFFYGNYLRNNPVEVLRLNFSDYCPWHVVVSGLLIIFSTLGILASIVWLLFFGIGE